MQISNKNNRIYLTTQNRRIHKYAQALTGYVKDADFERLHEIKNLVFPTYQAKDPPVPKPLKSQTISPLQSITFGLPRPKEPQSEGPGKFLRLSSMNMI